MKSLAVSFATALAAIAAVCAPSFAAKTRPLVVVVMDPLSAKLACDCVQGYAQRKYEALAEHLETELGREVQIVWSESLAHALKNDTEGRADLVIGKHSVVLHDAKIAKVRMIPVAALTGKDGKSTQTGLLVVRKDDKAQSVADLAGYRILFGPADCDEKSAAIAALLKTNGVSVPENKETADSCSVAATKLLELPPEEKAAAVISSYSQPLLEGCGTIAKGDLRVVGETEEVPFITAFVSESMPLSDRESLTEALHAVGTKPELLLALETLMGFVDFVPPDQVAGSAKKKN